MASSPLTPDDEIGEDEDVVDGVIRRTGCEEKYRAMENCLVFETNRDFRKCAQVMKDFQDCMKERQAAKK